MMHTALTFIGSLLIVRSLTQNPTTSSSLNQSSVNMIIATYKLNDDQTNCSDTLSVFIAKQLKLQTKSTVSFAKLEQLTNSSSLKNLSAATENDKRKLKSMAFRHNQRLDMPNVLLIVIVLPPTQKKHFEILPMDEEANLTLNDDNDNDNDIISDIDDGFEQNRDRRQVPSRTPPMFDAPADRWFERSTRLIGRLNLSDLVLVGSGCRFDQESSKESWLAIGGRSLSSIVRSSMSYVVSDTIGNLSSAINRCYQDVRRRVCVCNRTGRHGCRLSPKLLKMENTDNGQLCPVSNSSICSNCDHCGGDNQDETGDKSKNDCGEECTQMAKRQPRVQQQQTGKTAGMDYPTAALIAFICCVIFAIVLFVPAVFYKPPKTSQLHLFRDVDDQNLDLSHSLVQSRSDSASGLRTAKSADDSTAKSASLKSPEDLDGHPELQVCVIDRSRSRSRTVSRSQQNCKHPRDL